MRRCGAALGTCHRTGTRVGSRPSSVWTRISRMRFWTGLPTASAGARPCQGAFCRRSVGSPAAHFGGGGLRGGGLTAERAVERPPATPRLMARRDFRLVVLNWFRELTLVPVIVVLMIAGSLVNPVFFTTSNLINVAEGGAALGMVVVAESLILLTGKFDISLQGTLALAPLLGAWLIAPKASQGLGTEWNPWLGLLVVLLVGLAVGTV